MEITTKVIEMTGTIDNNHHLVLDETIPVNGPKKVRVLILFPEEEDIDENTWLGAVKNNPVFEFLKAPEEDIYSLDDGVPFNDKR